MGQAMSQALDHLRGRLDNEPLHTQLVVSREVLREALAEADRLHREHAGSRCELEAREIEKTALREERDRAAASRDRLFFEVQLLQMTQGALKMEIDRLRAERPQIAATGAELVISSNGAMVITADCLSITGQVVPA